MASLLARVEAVLHQYRKNLKELLSIPSFSESMAGVIIFFVFFNSMATSIWMFNAWTPFVYLLFDRSNMAVGVMSGVNGVCELIFAMVSGHVADKLWGPSRTLVFAVRLGVMNLLMVAIAVWARQKWLLILAQVFEGVYMGLSFTCVESVFAQCLHTGDRDRLYSVKFSMESSGPIVGLIFSIILYLVVGDAWTTRVLQVVMTAGLLLHLGSMLAFLYFFKPLPSHLDEQRQQQATDVTLTDGAAAGEDGVEGHSTKNTSDVPRLPRDTEETRVRDAMNNEELQLTPDAQDQNRNMELLNCARTSIMQSAIRCGPPPMVSQYEPSVCTARNEEDGNKNSNENANANAAASAADERASTAGYNMDDDGTTTMQSGGQGVNGGGAAVVDLKNIPPGAHVEYVDHEFEEATGFRRIVMTMLPLWIYPAAVVMADMVLIIGSGMTTQYFSLFMMSVYGVSPAAVAGLNLCNSIVIAFIAIVSGMMGKKYGRVRAMLPPKITGAFLLLYMALAQRTKYGPRFWMCVTYVLRNAFMNCSAGLSRALIMDLVPKERHGRWNALESVQSAGWSGTAILGGLMADRLGYGAAFIFTFVFHITATSALIPFTVRNDSRLPQPVLVYDKPADGSAAPEVAGGKSTSSSSKSPSAKAHTAVSSNVVVAELTAENVRKIASCVSLHREDDED